MVAHYRSRTPPERMADCEFVGLHTNRLECLCLRILVAICIWSRHRLAFLICMPSWLSTTRIASGNVFYLN